MRLRMHWQLWGAAGLLAMLLAGCGSVPKAPSTATSQPPATNSAASRSPSRDLPVLPPAGSGRGGYYQDDGPGDNPPSGLLDVPDAEPKIEPFIERANRPYSVFGKTYTPVTDNKPFRQRGVGSWYGKKFHGQKTSSGELYDMYKMTAAHPTLPIPSYARVTNLSTGAQVIVRVNDRGPFHSSRIIDLSYTAALKLGYLGKGSGQLEVERLLPDEIERIAGSRNRKPDAPADASIAQVVPSAPSVPSAPQASSRQTEKIPAVSASVVSVDDVIARSTDTAPAVVETAAVDMPVAPAVTATMTIPAQPLDKPAASAQAQAGPAPVAEAASAGGFYLQLGAYSQAANAQAICTQLRQKWAVSLPPIEVVESGTLYRLYSGPFATRADALLAAQQVIESGMSKPLVVQR